MSIIEEKTLSLASQLVNDENSTVRKLAEDAFKKHKITKLGENWYRWGEPRIATYQVFVLIKPYRLILYGDLGDWMFALDKDPLAHIRSCINPPSVKYFLSKCSSKSTPYNPDATKESIKEDIEETYSNSDKYDEIIYEFKKVAFDDENEVIAFVENILGEVPGYESLITDHGAEGAWIFLALQSFMKKLEPDLFKKSSN